MIRFEDVTMVYTPGAQPALDHVSLEVEREEFVFLLSLIHISEPTRPY